jgi:hypothetical protein
MRKDNTQNYQTTNSRIEKFKEFTDTKDDIKKELSKTNRQYLKNEDDVHNLPVLTAKNYNISTNKWDEDSKEQTKDKIDSIEIDNEKEHKFKISDEVKSFEKFNKK